MKSKISEVGKAGAAHGRPQQASNSKTIAITRRESKHSREGATSIVDRHTSTPPRRRLAASSHAFDRQTAGGMWLNRYSQHPSPSSSPAPQRRPSHLAPAPLPHRPGIANRSSSLSLYTNGSTDSLPAAARYPPAHSNLRNQLDASPVDNVPHPLDVLRDILAPVQSDSLSSDTPARHAANIDFGELSLQEFADAPSSSDQPSEQPSIEECMLVRPRSSWSPT
jgi:hypothetical protein